MANNKAKAQIQIDVSFVTNATKLVKDLQGGLKGLNLSSVLTKDLATGLNQGFKTLIGDLNKMGEGLSKKGLNPKQYQDFFNQMNTKILQSTGFITRLGKELDNIYDSDANKQAIKSLDDYGKKLEELKKISIEYNKTNTRQGTAAKKMFDETGVDYNVSKHTIRKIYNQRKEGKTNLTKGQQLWYDQNNLDEAKLKRILELYKQMESYEQKMATMRTQSNALSGKSNIEQGIKSLEHQIGSSEKMVITVETYKQWQQVLQTMLPYIQQVVGLSDQLAADMNTELPRATKQAEETAKTAGTIREILGQFGIVFSAAGVVNQFKQLVKYSYEFYKSLDSALNAIYVVSNLSSTAVNNLTDDFIQMAERTGMAIDDITQSAVLYFQQGLSTDEVLEMTEVTAQFAKVAGIDATDAADKLTAAVNGYCLAASDAASVADKFNQVAAASAADINELSTAFSKAAAQANQAGVGMDNYLAYIATMVEATREAPENIGTSLKTIMSRMQQVKDGGTTEDGDTDVNKVETALKSVGVALRDTKGELRDLEDVFDELGPKWQSLDRNTQAYLGTIIAGTRQQSRFITLMQNWDRVLELAEESENSAGMQALMHAKAMESVESKTKELNVAWQEFVSNLTDSSIIKGVITALTKMLKTINNGNKPLSLMISTLIIMRKQIGPLITGIVQWGKKQLETLGIFEKSKNGLTGFASQMEKTVVDLEEVGMQMDTNKKAMQGLESEIQSLTIEYNRLSEIQTQNKQEEKANAKVMEDTVKQINQKTEALNQLQRRQEELIRKQNALTGSLDGITTVMTGFSMAMSSLSGSSNKFISFLGTSLGMLSQFTVIGLQGTKAITSFARASTMAAGAAKSALVSTGAGALVVVLGEIVNLAMKMYDTFANGAEKLKESVDKVMDSIDEYQNAVTAQKGVDKLAKQYNDLRKQTHLTEEEQQKLNETAQSLADNLDIGYIEDSYGNITLDINELNDAINDLDVQKLEALKQVIQIEKDEGYNLFGQKSGFYDKFFAGNLSTLRKIMTNFSKEVSEEFKNVFGEEQIEALNKDIQTSILEMAEETSDSFAKGFTASEFISQTSEEINEAISDSEAEAMYKFVHNLQNSMSGMTYEQTMDRISGFVEAWGDAAGLTVQQIEIMKNAIADFAYGNTEENIHNIVKQIDDKIKLYSRFKLDAKVLNFVGGTSESDGNKVLRKFLPKDGKKALDQFLQDGNKEVWDNWVKDNQEKYDEAWVQLYMYASEKQKLTYGTKFEGDDQPGLKIYENLVLLKKIIQENTNEMNTFLSSMGALDDVGESKAVDFLTKTLDLQKIAGAFGESAEAGASEYITQLGKAIEANRGTNLEEALQERLTKATENLTLPRDWSWSDVGTEITEISDDLQTLNKVMEEINESGGLSIDTFTDFCGVLDRMVDSFDELAAAGQLDNMSSALSAMKIGYNELTGAIGVNKDAVQSLQTIEQALVKTQLEGIKKQLLAKSAQFDVQIRLLKAEWSANNLMIQSLKDKGEADIALTDIETEGAKVYNDAMKVASADIGSYYYDLATDSQNYARTSVAAFTAVAEAMSKVITGELTPQAAEAVVQNAFKNAQATWSSYAGSGLKYSGDEGKIKASEAAAILQQQNDRIANTIKDFELQKKNLANIYNFIATLADKDTDLSKLGTDGKAAKELEKYIGKLKEIYNILNRIQLLNHRLDVLGDYADIEKGELYAKHLKERMTLNQELLNQHKFLVTEQKKFANGYIEYIENSNLADVFSFDEYGQIIIDFEKYNALQDTAADGQKSMKEQADEMYEAYTEMFDDLQGYFDDYITHLKEAIKLNEEVINNYVDLEKQAADVIKDIYQDILDTKLEAIDKEIEALDDLQKAREEAREDQENAKEVSGLQTNLQRAMFDTSGASDSAQIKARQDLNDKLDAMADDQYSEMLENLKTQLEDQKEMLQEEFDEMFENIQWLYEMIENEFMNDQGKLDDLLSQDATYQNATKIERAQMKQDWETKMSTITTTLMGEGEPKSIYDLWDETQKMREATEALDEALKTREINVGVAVANAIAQSNSSSKSGGGGGNGSSNYTYKDYYSQDTNGNGINIDGNGPTNTGDKEPPPEDTSYRKWIGKTAEIKGQGNLKVLSSPNETDTQYVFNPPFVNPNVIIQDVFKGESGQYWLKTNWKGGVWVAVEDLQTVGLPWGRALDRYKQGGFADFTGPAWLDGTPQKPEAVLNALQTEHFVKFTNALDHMYGQMGGPSTANSIMIDTISFKVDSMSSPEDGEAAFDAFVNKFKEIGSQRGMKINNFKNIL